MTKHSLHHFFSVMQALVVTFLWSTSFIIIKWGLADIPPITFAGLRYFLAFLCFLPFIFKKQYIGEIRGLAPRQWWKLIILGFVFYTLTQGSQFLGLALLPAVSVSLMLNFTPLIVAILGVLFINEIPSRLQWVGAIIFMVGILFYFLPLSFDGEQGLGLMVMVFGVLANSGAGILGRDINKQRNISPVVITFISMGVGSIALLVAGIMVAGAPDISPQNWVYLAWLAIVNTAFAFTLWNHTLRSISAMESSIINGTMLIQIAFLAWFFLDEKISTQEGIGMGIAVLGATLVQIKHRKSD
jgi:drug/metabolite transporter (DMT)-like permease